MQTISYRSHAASQPGAATMNASEMTFGIEIETIAPDTAVQQDGLRIGPYHRGIQVPYLPVGWKAEHDTGGPMRVSGFFRPVVIDLSGLRVPSRSTPVFRDH